MTGVRGRLDRFADFIFCLADEKGCVPSIGDDDEGRALSFVPAHGTYAFDIARRIKPPVTLASRFSVGAATASFAIPAGM